MKQHPVVARQNLGPVSLFDHFDSMMSQWLQRPSLWDRMESEVSFPALDVSETDKELLVNLEMAGMDPNDISVNLSEDSLLTIKGEKRRNEEEGTSTCHCCERYFGTVERTLQLPVKIDSQKVEAAYENGVLRLTLPKAEPGGTQTITVKSK